MATSTTDRPYRSHKIPACERCRKRKIRCNFDLIHQECIYCRGKGLDCVVAYPTRDSSIKGAVSQEVPDAVQRKRPRHREGASDVIGPPHDSEPRLRPSPATDRNGETWAEMSSIVGPMVAEDIEVIDSYLLPNAPKLDDDVENESHTKVQRKQNPVLYQSVPRRRSGLTLAHDSGTTQYRIAHHMFHSFKSEMIAL